MELGGAPPRRAARLPQRGYGVDQRGAVAPIADVSGGELRREGDALPLDQDMVLRAQLAPIGGVGPGRRPPFFARTLRLSWLARDQSSRPAWPSRSNNAWCSRCHTTARCQSRSRRQQVTPLQQPIS